MSLISELINDAIDKAVNRAVEQDQKEIDPDEVVDSVLNSLRVDEYEDAIRYLLRHPIVNKFRSRRVAMSKVDILEDREPERINNQNRTRFYAHRRLLRILHTTYPTKDGTQKFFKEMTTEDLDYVIAREMIQGKGAIKRAVHLKRVRSAISDYPTVGQASDAGAIDLVSMVDELDTIDVGVVDSIS